MEGIVLVSYRFQAALFRTQLGAPGYNPNTELYRGPAPSRICAYAVREKHFKSCPIQV